MRYFVFALIFMLWGCNIDKILHTPKHDTKKLNKIHARNESVVSNGCAVWYPFVPIDTSETSFFTDGYDTSGYETTITSGTTTEKIVHDSLIYYHTDTAYMTRDITKTIEKNTIRTITKLDSASLARKQNKVDSLYKEITTLDKLMTRSKTQRNLFMWLFFGSLAISGAIIYFKPKIWKNPIS